LSDLVLWRLVKTRHIDDAFSGEGARRYGGRWNARGTAVVYLSGGLSLAALELFVHLTAQDARLNFSAIQVDVPSAVKVQQLALTELPDNWREEPPPDGCKLLGSRWVERTEAALLRVPSIIVPNEFNYVLNPAHADFKKIIVRAPQPFGFDTRMWK
jgi:RES domain-containing protein